MILVSTGLIGKPLKDDNVQTKVMDVANNCFLSQEEFISITEKKELGHYHNI